MSTRTVGLALVLASIFVSPALAAPAAHAQATPRSWNVYVDGHYVGADPDPFIRNELARDWCTDC